MAKGARVTKEKDFIDELLKDYEKPEDLLGENGLLKELTKRLLERVMAVELTQHVGYEKHEAAGNNSGNSRNGSSEKTLKGSFGTMPIAVPRDRNGTFEPQIIEKNQTRFSGFDANIISLYARGLSAREIQQHLEEIYHVEVSPSLISAVTDGVLEEVKSWQGRQLDKFYPIVIMDAIMFKVRDGGQVRNKAVYLVIGVNMDGYKEVLGMWIQQTEGAKFWLQVMTELNNRGVKDILIACVDGLKGFPEAIESVFPQTLVQLCIVHLIRHSLRFVAWKERKEVARDLKEIYTAATAEAGAERLNEFSAKWDARFPMISKTWRDNWIKVIPFFAHPPDIRRAIYTTNAIESMNMTLRKVTKARGSFPHDEALFKLLFLALNNIAKKWTMPIPNWKRALNGFSILYEGRVPVPGS
jgi:putative transposase